MKSGCKLCVTNEKSSNNCFNLILLCYTFCISHYVRAKSTPMTQYRLSKCYTDARTGALLEKNMKPKNKFFLSFLVILLFISCTSTNQDNNSKIKSDNSISNKDTENSSTTKNSIQQVPLPTVLGLFNSKKEYLSLVSTLNTVDGITVYNCVDYIKEQNVLFQVGFFKIENDEGKINEFGFVILDEPFMKEVYWVPGTPMPGDFESEEDIPKGKILSPSGIAPEAIIATYKKEGLNNIWYWNNSDDTSYYEIIIEPDGTVLYYDFTNSKDGDSVKPRYIYKGRKEKISF